MAGINAKKWVTKKLTNKKQYEAIIYKEGLFSIAVITALGLLSEENREIMCVTDEYAELYLNMDIEQKTAIELALRDYLVELNTVEEVNSVRIAVYK